MFFKVDNLAALASHKVDLRATESKEKLTICKIRFWWIFGIFTVCESFSFAVCWTISILILSPRQKENHNSQPKAVEEEKLIYWRNFFAGDEKSWNDNTEWNEMKETKEIDLNEDISQFVLLSYTLDACYLGRLKQAATEKYVFTFDLFMSISKLNLTTRAIDMSRPHDVDEIQNFFQLVVRQSGLFFARMELKFINIHGTRHGPGWLLSFPRFFFFLFISRKV